MVTNSVESGAVLTNRKDVAASPDQKNPSFLSRETNRQELMRSVASCSLDLIWTVASFTYLASGYGPSLQEDKDVLLGKIRKTLKKSRTPALGKSNTAVLMKAGLKSFYQKLIPA